VDEAAVRPFFAPVIAVHTRSMFGGVGIYAGEGPMFALLLDGTVYLKTTPSSVPRFEAAGSEPFIYEAKGIPRQTSYWSLPSEAYEDSDALKRWTGLALEAARMAATGKLRPRGSSSPARPR